MAFVVLNHKWWRDVVFKQDKPDYLQLDMYVLHEISLIIENYRNFFADVTGKQVVDEWTANSVWLCKKPSLMSMPFKRLWARMLSMFTAHFQLMLRSVAIAIDVPNRHLRLRAPHEPHERLAGRVRNPDGARLPALSNVVVH
jgi:hypothetical protein